MLVQLLAGVEVLHLRNNYTLIPQLPCESWRPIECRLVGLFDGLGSFGWFGDDQVVGCLAWFFLHDWGAGFFGFAVRPGEIAAFARSLAEAWCILLSIKPGWASNTQQVQSLQGFPISMDIVQPFMPKWGRQCMVFSCVFDLGVKDVLVEWDSVVLLPVIGVLCIGNYCTCSPKSSLCPCSWMKSVFIVVFKFTQVLYIA